MLTNKYNWSKIFTVNRVIMHHWPGSLDQPRSLATVKLLLTKWRFIFTYFLLLCNINIPTRWAARGQISNSPQAGQEPLWAAWSLDKAFRIPGTAAIAPTKYPKWGWLCGVPENQFSRGVSNKPWVTVFFHCYGIKTATMANFKSPTV